MTSPPRNELSGLPAMPSATGNDALPRHVLGDLIWSSSRRVRLLRRVVVSLAFLFGLAMLRVPVESLVPPLVYRKDFLQEYLLARAVAEQVDPYLPIPILASRFVGPLPVPVFPHPTPHPPFVGLLFSPLVLLDYPSAARAWLGFEAVCLVASAYLLARVAGVQGKATTVLTTGGIALLWFPVLQDLTIGQLMLPLLLLLAGSRCAIQSERRAISGALIGISILLKPVAWPVFLVFVVRRDWRPLIGSLSTVLVGYTAAAWVIGAGPVFAYLTQVLPAVSSLYRTTAWNISVWTVGWRIFDGTRSEVLPGISAPPLMQSTQAAAVVSVALPALILLSSLAVIRERSEATSFGLMICVGILVSPISWSHYLVLAAIPAVEVGAWLVRHKLPSRKTNAALLVAILLFFPGNGWTSLALAVTGNTPASDGTALIPFGPALLTMGPAVAVTALAILLVALPDLPSGDSEPEEEMSGAD